MEVMKSDIAIFFMILLIYKFYAAVVFV